MKPLFDQVSLDIVELTAQPEPKEGSEIAVAIDEIILELVTPFVLESEYPNAHDQGVPWWWKEDRRDLREREEKMLEQREAYKLQTVNHGQAVAYEGDRSVETAKSGILRGGSHSKYVFHHLRTGA